MADSYYVTLPSNSSMDVNPSNTLTHYRVNLPSAMIFDGDWEVALAEFSYPHRWLNVIEGHNHIFCSAGEGDQVHVHKIPEGYYPTPEDLISRIDPPISHDKLVRIKYNRFIQKIIVKTEEGVRLALAKRLASLMGFDEGGEITGVEKAPRVINLRPVQSMFIYTDIIEYNVVGDIRAPLLRIVNVDGEYGQTVTKTFVAPHYVPLKQKAVNTIEIDIRDDTGRFIPFMDGKVVAKLHFRRRRSSYFQ